MALGVAIGLVILGACILAAALVPAGKLIARLPSGQLRYSWIVLTALMFASILGYIGFASMQWDGDTPLSDLAVPLVFFGICLVLAVSTLAFASAQYVHRLTALENENITDPLMGIANYRHLIVRLNEEVARSNRYRSPLALLMVNPDHFAKINDTYGYSVGDFVLIALAKVVLGIARDTDITARYGPEEIAIIAPNTSAADAATLAERIRQAVEAASLLPAEVRVRNEANRVTVSIGVSSLGPHVRSVQALIVAATGALLIAKGRGRNCIAVH